MPQSTFLYAVPSVLNISFPLQSDVGTLTHLHGPVQKSPSSKAFHYGPRVHHFLLQISTAFHVLTLESLGLSLRITHSRSIPWHCVADAQSLACTWMKVKVKVIQLCPTLCDPSPWNSPGQNTGVGSLSSGDLPNPGIKPRSPALQADSLPAKPQGKPKNTEVGSLPLLQGIFPAQELNQGLLHCRRIQGSCQGSCQGSPVSEWMNATNPIVFSVTFANVLCIHFSLFCVFILSFCAGLSDCTSCLS